MPPGLGEPVFDKLKADLGKALLSLPDNTVANPDRGRYVIEDKLLERWLHAQPKS